MEVRIVRANRWNILKNPLINERRKCFGILRIKMGQLILCNDGDGYYGYLKTNIKDNISFTSTLCGNDIEIAKKEIIKKFIMHVNCIALLCTEQKQELV